MSYKTVKTIRSLRRQIQVLDDHIATHIEKRDRLQGRLDELRGTLADDPVAILERARTRKQEIMREIEEIEKELQEAT